MVMPYGIIGNTSDFGSEVAGSSPVRVTIHNFLYGGAYKRNIMMHKYKYLGNNTYKCERCGIVRIDDYRHKPQYYDKDNKPLSRAGTCK